MRYDIETSVNFIITFEHLANKTLNIRQIFCRNRIDLVFFLNLFVVDDKGKRRFPKIYTKSCVSQRPHERYFIFSHSTGVFLYVSPFISIGNRIQGSDRINFARFHYLENQVTIEIAKQIEH